MQLTKLVKSMAASKSKDLESALDRAESLASGDSGLSSGSARSKAAVYRKLRKALVESPAMLYESVETLILRGSSSYPRDGNVTRVHK